MKKYFKLIIFYALAVTEAVINFIFALVGSYPKLDWSSNWLVNRELARVSREIHDRHNSKEKELNKADNMVNTAKELSYDVWETE
tara:strand:- start:2881 stop:3135 length:255 start_codon:yes stop_codon:yes gene_type:complete